MFFSNLLVGTDYGLKNRYDTLEEMAIIRLISENPMITQKESVKATGKSISTVKRNI